MKELVWTVRLQNAPAVHKYCKKCGVKTEFVSSGNFRVNAHQKCLDVWLIYKCTVCDSTWNLTIFTRVAPRAVSPDLLQGFYDNDPALARHYAADTALIKRCGADPAQPDIEITGDSAEQSETIRLHLIPEQPLEIKAEAVLRKKLGLSRSDFDKMLLNGQLECISGHNLKKCKLSGEIVVVLH